MQSKLLKLIKQSFNFMIIIIMISTLISINNIEQTKKNNITEKTIERPFNKREIKKISAGDSHSLAIDKSGNLWVWGDNSFGQLGKGTKDDISAPLQIKQGTKFVELSAGYNHSLAIDESGNLWAWGNNEHGQLGNGTTTGTTVPIQIMSGTKFVKISAGHRYSLTIDADGNLWTFGCNITGELGDGTTIDKISPVQIKSGTKFIEISAGTTSYDSHSLAIDQSGNLWAWGYNAQGQLGDGTTIDKISPVQIKSGTKFIEISAGDGHSLGIDADKNLWTWGHNSSGQLGNGTTTTSTTPTKIKFGTKFKEISAGAGHSLAIDESGNLWAWGYNAQGQLGNGGTGNDINLFEDSIQTIPIKVKPETRFKVIDAGGDFSLAIDDEKGLWGWGNNLTRELGILEYIEPMIIKEGTKFVKISAKDKYNLAIDESGNLWTWGINEYGQLGNGNTKIQDIPMQIMSGTKFKEISAGYKHSLAIDEEGKLWAWGFNYHGQLGNGTTTTSSTPIQIMSGTKFKKISAGWYHSLAIDEEGKLWAWGFNSYGTLGNGTTTGTTVPIQIMPGTEFEEISAYEHSLAIDKDGNLWAWGYNAQGQLGDGTIINKLSPVQINSGIKFKEISATWQNNFAIDEEGKLWAWGSNAPGTFGNGTTTSSYVPIKVKEGTIFKSISAGYNHNLAIDEDGSLCAWGDNYYGELGDGTLNDSRIPIQIMSGTIFKEIATGENHSIAIDEEGKLWTWGKNNIGQLGNGENHYKKTPVLLARYEEIIFNIDFHTNGGTINSGNITNYIYGTSVTLPTDVTKDGHIFDGWYKDSNFTGTAITKITSTDTGDKTYYAKWLVNEYTVIFKNEGNIEKTEIVEYGLSATAPTLIKPGYTLSWDKDFSNITENLTVNAIWVANTNTPYKVEHYLRTGDMEVESYSLHESENKTGTTGEQVTATAKTYTGFTENTTHSDRIISGTVAADGSLVLKLYYDRNTYNITYELNGGTATSTLTTTYLYGKQIVLSNRVEKEGYTFAGWYDNSSLTGTAVTSISEQETGNKTFYAKWVENDELTISSTKYTINEEERYITHVSPNTKLTAFLSNITTNGIAEVVNLNGNTISAEDFVGTGYKLKITLNGETKEYEIVVRGDIDGNGKITVTDLSMLNQHIVRRITLTGVREKAADIEYSGKITVTDLSMMNQALVGRITL